MIHQFCRHVDAGQAGIMDLQVRLGNVVQTPMMPLVETMTFPTTR